MRFAVFACLTLSVCSILPLCLADATPAEPVEWLIRAERLARDDLAQLRARDLPVVMEMEKCLLLRGKSGDLEKLSEAGYPVRVLDRQPAGTAYAVLGLRPDSDRSLIESAGSIIHEESNWVILRVEGEASLSALHQARVFLTPLPTEISRTRAHTRDPILPGPLDAAVPDPLVEKIVAVVDNTEIDNVFGDLTANPPEGTRFSQSQGCRDASDYCLDFFQDLGLQAQYHEWSANDAPNVVAEIEGALRPDQIYIVLGHLDDLPSSGPAPGADDNASGSVNVLESARAMSCWAYKNTVRFLTVTGEEQGLKGSHAYAQDSLDAGETVLGAINMDMIAWDGDGSPEPEDLDLSYNDSSEWLGLLFAQNASTYNTGLVVDAFYCPSLTASDHYAFWQRGYDAVVGITDNENYCSHPGNYPYYHTSDDTIANCGDLSFFYSVVRTSVATLAELSEPFKITFSEPAYGCVSAAQVLVGDHDLNTDPGIQETITVTVSSTREPGAETITLLERGTDSMIFEGSLALSDQPPVGGDGLLSVDPGDTLEAEYVDDLDCDGATGVSYRASSVVDCAKPVITNISESDVSDVSATIHWTTDEIADSEVIWGESLPVTQSVSDAGRVTAHALELDGLEECRVYYYEVRSRDPAGNLAVADNGGQYYHFETMGDFGDGLQPCHEGRVSLEDPSYSCQDTVSFTLVDLDLNTNPGVAETTVVDLTSTSEVTPEKVTLTETAPNSSRFSGSIATDSGPVLPDGLLQLGHDEVITVTYHDADDGAGATSLSFDTATSDCAGPVITGLRVDTITNARATVLFETDEPSDSTVEWGLTPALGGVVSDAGLVTSHALLLNDFDSCQTLYLRVRATDQFSQSSLASGATGPFSFQAGEIPGLYWRESFEGDVSGWTLGGEWEVGQPAALGGSSGLADPPAAYNNTLVLGHDLSGQGSYPGDYEAGILEKAFSPSQNATTWSDTRLLIYRQLASGPGDDASLWLWTGPGRRLFTSGEVLFEDGDYALMSFDLGILVDGRPQVQLEFRQEAGSGGQYSGWNVDEIIFKNGNLPDYQACGGCQQPPAFSGATGAEDLDACAAGGVRVRWDQAVAWGSGSNGSFTVYRSLLDDFTPAAGNQIAAGVTGLDYTDGGAPANQDLYYIVQAENNEGCAAGPANGGLMDANTVRVQATDSSSADLPLEAGPLEVRLTGSGSHLRISWSSSPGASQYRVLRGLSPQPGEFSTLADTAGLYHDDQGVGADRQAYFYLLKGINPCGQEGP